MRDNLLRKTFSRNIEDFVTCCHFFYVLTIYTYILGVALLRVMPIARSLSQGCFFLTQAKFDSFILILTFFLLSSLLFLYYSSLCRLKKADCRTFAHGFFFSFFFFNLLDKKNKKKRFLCSFCFDTLPVF